MQSHRRNEMISSNLRQRERFRGSRTVNRKRTGKGGIMAGLDIIIMTCSASIVFLLGLITVSVSDDIRPKSVAVLHASFSLI